MIKFYESLDDYTELCEKILGRENDTTYEFELLQFLYSISADKSAEAILANIEALLTVAKDEKDALCEAACTYKELGRANGVDGYTIHMCYRVQRFHRDLSLWKLSWNDDIAVRRLWKLLENLYELYSLIVRGGNNLYTIVIETTLNNQELCPAVDQTIGTYGERTIFAKLGRPVELTFRPYTDDQI